MRYLCPIALLVACSSCSTAPNAAPVAVGPTSTFASATPRHLGPVITRFAMRTRTITARAGIDAGGPTYSLETPGGHVLVPDMTLGELARKNPDLNREIRAMDTAVLWAGTD